MAPLLLDLCKQHDFGRLAFESEHVSVATYDSYREALEDDVELIGSRGAVENLRVAKNRTRWRRSSTPSRLPTTRLPSLLAWLRHGVTEKAVAWRLEVLMREGGAEGLSFPSIVAAGPNGAMPHHRPGDDIIPSDTFIVMDFGCIADGYCSDMTRTVVLGTPSPEMQAVYRLVLKAQEAAEAQVRAGMTGAEADALAREVIVSAGHGDHFGHGLGHGVGLKSTKHHVSAAGRRYAAPLPAQWFLSSPVSTCPVWAVCALKTWCYCAMTVLIFSPDRQS